MESHRPGSSSRKYGGDMYGGRSSYTKSKELPVNSDEENLHDSLSDDELFANFNAASSKGSKYTTDNSRMSANKYGSEAAHSLYSGGRQHEDEFPSNRQNPMMMTIKKPMQASSRRPASPPARSKQSSKLGLLDENVNECEESSEDELSYMSNKPSFLKSHQRPKSPSVRGRHPGSALGELSEDRPKPLPRQKRLQDDDDDVKQAVLSSRTPPNVLDRKTPPTRRTPTSDQRMTPVDRHRSPAGDRDLFADRHKMNDSDARGESQRSPLGRHSFADRKSPHSDPFQTKDRYEYEEGKQSFSRYGASRKSPSDRVDSADRKTPLSDPFQTKDRYEYEERKQSFDRYGASRKSPSDRVDSADRKTPLSDRRPSGTLSRKSPLDNDKFRRYDQQKSPVDDRKTPTSDRRKTPVEFQRKKEDSSATRRKGSVVDFLTESTGVKESENSDEEQKYRDRRKSGSSQSHGRKSTSPSLKRSESTEKNPFENIRKSPGASSKASKHHRRSPDSLDKKPARPRSQTRRKSSREKDEGSDGDSSVCEELIEEPVKPEITDKEQTANEDRSKNVARRSDQQKSEETIELVKGAQSESSKMRYIDPAKTEIPPATAKRPSSGSGKLSTTTVYKPKPRYAKPEVTLPTPFTSTSNFESTVQIRDAAYKEWLAKRSSQFKRRASLLTLKEKELEEHNAKEKEEKIENAKKAYEAWKQEKDSRIGEKDLKKRKEEEKAKMEEEKKKNKKEEATLVFDKWKSEADEKLKEEKRKKVRKQRQEEDAKKDDTSRKREDSASAYNMWKRNKDEKLISQHIEKKREIKKSKDEELREEKQREKEAARAYERWLYRKERSDSRQSTHVDEERRPWRPSTVTASSVRS